MSIKLKLLTSLAGLALALLFLGGVGFLALELTTQKTRTIVADGVVGLGDLTSINDMYSNIVRDTQGVVLGELSFAEGAASLSESLQTIEEKWADYKSLPVAPETVALTAEADKRMLAAKGNIAQLTTLLAGNDLLALTSFAKTTLGDTMESIASQFDQLAEIQIGVAQADFDSAESIGAIATWVLIGVALASAAMIVFAIYTVLRGVLAPLNAMQLTMQRLASGDLSVEVPFIGRKDEIGKMAASVGAFHDNALRVAKLAEEQQQFLADAADSAGQLAAISKAQAVIEFDLAGQDPDRQRELLRGARLSSRRDQGPASPHVRRARLCQ